MTSLERLCLLLALACAPWARAQVVLRYDEAAERVTIYRGETATTYDYDGARKGFVGADGNIVSWVDARSQWQLKGPSGVLADFGADGRAIAAQPARPRGYHPLDDVGDAPASTTPDLQPAWKYLESRDQTVPDAASPMVGDDGGPAATFDAVGGDASAREKELREKWQGQKGAHQGDPEGAMDTGKPSDPLGKLRDTLKQAATAVRDLRQTGQEIDSIGDELRGDGSSLFDDDDDPLPDANAGGGGSAAAGAMMGAPAAGSVFADPASLLGGGAAQDAKVDRLAAPPDATVIPSPIPDDGRMR
jgi:hypothetical protein